MIIASYNIASGGFKNYSYELDNPERIMLIIEAVRKIDADFIGFIDTFRWEDEFTNVQLQQMFNYRFAHSLNLQDKRLKALGHNNDITVLTNLPVIKSESLFIHTRNCIKTLVDIGSRKLQIFSTYLDDISEDIRLIQAAELLRNVEKNIPAIILGDINTTNPDHILETIEKIGELFKERPELEDRIGSVLKEMSRGEVIEELKLGGFHSANNTHAPTVATPLFMKLGLQKPLIQLDHIFLKGLGVRSFEVAQKKVFDKASDHYPVIAKITI